MAYGFYNVTLRGYERTVIPYTSNCPSLHFKTRSQKLQWIKCGILRIYELETLQLTFSNIQQTWCKQISKCHQTTAMLETHIGICKLTQAREIDLLRTS